MVKSRKKLTEAQMIKVIAESYKKKLNYLMEAGGEEYEIDVKKDIDNDGKPETLVSPGLKVKHKDSGLLYTIATVQPDHVTLKTPDSELFDVSADEFEEEYKLA